jgi:hypothetical protein
MTALIFWWSQIGSGENGAATGRRTVVIQFQAFSRHVPDVVSSATTFDGRSLAHWFGRQSFTVPCRSMRWAGALLKLPLSNRVAAARLVIDDSYDGRRRCVRDTSFDHRTGTSSLQVLVRKICEHVRFSAERVPFWISKLANRNFG